MTTPAVRRPPNRCSYATGTVADLTVTAELQHQRRIYDLDAEQPVAQPDELMVLDCPEEPQDNNQLDLPQLDNDQGGEDPFFLPPLNWTEPQPPATISPEDLQSCATSFAKLTQARYDDETMAFGFFQTSMQESLKLVRNENQTKIIKAALSNFPKYWARLINAEAEDNVVTTAAIQSRSFANVTSNETNDAAPSPKPRQQKQDRQPDRRVLIRMPSAAAEILTGYSIKRHITDQLQLTSTQLLDAHRIPSGWAVLPDNIATRDKILLKQVEWLPGLKGQAAEKKETWHTYVVDNVPRTLHDITGNAIGVLQAARDEIIAQTKLQPVEFHIARKDTGLLPDVTLVVSFTEKVERPWRLFSCSNLARIIQRRAKISQCQHCWGYHSTIVCTKPPCCKNCGGRDHNEEACSLQPRCANCLGPHPADYFACYAKPKTRNGAVQRLSKLERQLARRQGARDYAENARREIADPSNTTTPPPAVVIQVGTPIDDHAPCRAETPALHRMATRSQRRVPENAIAGPFTDAITSPPSNQGSPSKRPRMSQHDTLSIKAQYLPPRHRPNATQP